MNDRVHREGYALIKIDKNCKLLWIEQGKLLWTEQDLPSLRPFLIELKFSHLKETNTCICLKSFAFQTQKNLKNRKEPLLLSN